MRGKLLATFLALSFLAPLAPAAAPKPAPPKPGAPVDGVVPSFADGTPIAYHAEGQGRPAVVFIHCWSGNQGYWNGVLPEVAKTHRVVTLDLAGHGKSGRGRKAWTMQAYGADVKTVVEKLGLGKIILVGHSMGGPVALEAARIMPERVVGIVPVDTLLDADARDPKGDAEYLAQMKADLPGTTRQFIPAIFGKEADPQLVKRVADEMAAADPAAAIGSMESLMAYDEAAGLKATRAPIKAINGDRRAANLAANRKYHPNFDAVSIAGSGHFPQFEKPAEFLKALLETLAAFPAR